MIVLSMNLQKIGAKCVTADSYFGLIRPYNHQCSAALRRRPSHLNRIPKVATKELGILIHL
jgi:hypothetical protein